MLFGSRAEMIVRVLTFPPNAPCHELPPGGVGGRAKRLGCYRRDSPHRYFASRCFRWSPASPYLTTPRTERRMGASSTVGEGEPATAAR